MAKVFRRDVDDWHVAEVKDDHSDVIPGDIFIIDGEITVAIEGEG